MATPTTEHDYPPIDSQGIHTFITNQGGTLTGDLQTDFRNALFISVAPGGKANDYSIDDLWQRHVITNISSDSNAETGNPATAGRGKSGFVGLRPIHYYEKAFLKNPGNANAFPGSTSMGDIGESIQGWHLAEVWHDGGDKTNSSWDLSKIVNDTAHTANEINSINWANEGSALLTANPNQDSTYGFTCSTPYDASTAVWDGTRVGTATTVLLQGADWSHDGNYYLTNNTWAKRLDMHAAATPYKVDSTDVRSSTCTNAELGFDDTITGNACMSPDGTAVYAIGEMQVNTISLLKRTLGTPYDLSDRGALVTQEVESQGITTISSSTAHLMIDATETYMWYASGGTLARGTMSTPGDITTITWVWDVADKFNPLMDGGSMTGACWDHTGTRLYCVNSGATAADSEMRVFTRAGAANSAATGTLTGATLNGMSKVQTLTDGGVGVLDLNPLVLALTTKKVESMQWGVDGK
jgi:hypothetical protein